MNYRVGFVVSMALHGLILLSLFHIYWPSVSKNVGWKYVKTIQSYVFSPKSHSTSKKVSGHQTQIKSIEKNKQKPPMSKQINPKIPHVKSGKSQGVNNHLLIALHNAINKQKVYPENAQLMSEQGIVLVSFILNASGSITNARIVKSSGYALLDQAAIQAVKAINPFQAREVKRATKLAIKIEFELGD